jgi:ADP-ribose pyrophosphatase YjhB (NUDIX family)
VTGAPADYCPACGTATERRENKERERRFCPTCEQFVWRNPVPVGTVVVHSGDGALFVRRSVPPDEGQWDLPGGFLETDEPPAYGAARELEEETGVRADPADVRLCGVGHERRGDRYLLPVVYAVARAETAGDPVAGSDADAVRVARPDDLDPLRDVALSRYRLATGDDEP